MKLFDEETTSRRRNPATLLGFLGHLSRLAPPTHRQRFHHAKKYSVSAEQIDEKGSGKKRKKFSERERWRTDLLIFQRAISYCILTLKYSLSLAERNEVLSKLDDSEEKREFLFFFSFFLSLFTLQSQLLTKSSSLSALISSIHYARCPTNPPAPRSKSIPLSNLLARLKIPKPISLPQRTLRDISSLLQHPNLLRSKLERQRPSLHLKRTLLFPIRIRNLSNQHQKVELLALLLLQLMENRGGKLREVDPLLLF